MAPSATASPADAAIDIQDLRKTYRGGWFGKSYEALRGVTFSVNRGEIFALLGPNGAGKTTLIKVLLGIARRTQGRATLLGKPAGDRGSRRHVGYLPEQLRLPKHHNSLTALSLLGRLSGMTTAEIRERRTPLLRRVGLERWAKQPLREYSKGMLQRLGLAQALLHDPELLILDEPTDGLDPVGRREVRQVLEELKREGKTVFINSHLLQEVELFCDRVAILAHGQLRHLGTVDDLAANTLADTTLVTLIVQGDQAALETALRAAAADESTTSQERLDDAWRVTMNLGDQAAIDRCVDALRAANVSIVHLAKKRLTLEDAFLSLVGSGAEAPGANF